MNTSTTAEGGRKKMESIVLGRRTFRILIIGVLVLGLMSCLNPLKHNALENGTASDRGTDGPLQAVTIHLSDMSAMTILPDVQSLVDRYDITLSSAEYDDQSQSSATGPFAFSAVEVGSWEVLVEGVDEDAGDTVVATGTADFEVVENGDNSVGVTLAPTDEGNGAVDVTVTWPAGTIDGLAAAELVSGGGGETDPVDVSGDVALDTGGDAGSATYVDGELPSGLYRLTLSFSLEGEVVARVIEVLHVFDGVTSSETIDLTASQIGAAPPEPTDGSVTYTGANAFTLSWSDASNTEEGFNIYEGAPDGTPDFVAAANAVSADSGPAELDWQGAGGQTVTFSVTAFNDFGESLPLEIDVHPPAGSPQFSEDSGTYTTPFDLEITSPDGGTIYYTTDGSTPDDSSTEYTGAIAIEAPIDVTVHAIVYADGFSPSDVSSVSFSDGIITVTNGNLNGPGSLDQAILDANSGDTIVFDGSYTITQAGTNPSAPQWFVIDKDLTIDAEDNIITLDANLAGRHFNVGNGASFSLLGTNLTLSDGASLSSPSQDSKAGGSIFLSGQNTDLQVDGVTFRDNTTLPAGAPNQEGASGGAIFVSGGSVTIRNAHFSNNESETWGGAIGMANGPSSSVHISNSTFENNVAGNETSSGNFGGGAIAVSGTGEVEVYSSTFSANQAGAVGLEREAGAIRNAGTLTVSSSTFTRNVVYGDGGAIFSRNSGSVTRIYNSSFNGNNASELGAAVAATAGELVIVSSVFAGNLGTAVTAHAGTNTIVNATFAENQGASVSGVEFSSGTNELANSAFDATANPTSGTFTSHNNIGPGGFSDADSIDDDPLFVSAPKAGGDATWGTSDDEYGDLSLQSSSAAIDSGDTARLPADTYDVDGDGDTVEDIPTDRAGNTRVVGTAVDMGAYERQ